MSNHRNRQIHWTLGIFGFAIVGVFVYLAATGGFERQFEKSEGEPDFSVASGDRPESPLPRPLVLQSIVSSLTTSENPGFVGYEACAKCHSENYEAAIQTKHFRACREVRDGDMPNGFDNEKSKFRVNDELTFAMHREDGKYWMETIQGEAEGVAIRSQLDLIIGSGGKFDDVFLNWKEDGTMNELPMCWLYPSSEWATSNFDPHGSGDRSRPLTARCLECHNTWVSHVVGTVNQYRREGALLGVTCESCHGPAADHVEYHKANPNADDTKSIINPASLDRDGLIEVCSKCHSNAMKRRGPAFSARPEMPTEVAYKTLHSAYHEDDHVADQTTYMKASKCFQASEMTCITCHDPHHADEGHMQSQTACYQCHTPENCNDRPNLPSEVRDRCIDCHMPEFVKLNVSFNSTDDRFMSPILRWQHDIAIYPLAKQRLMRDYYASQDDLESRTKAEAITADLVASYHQQANELQQESRFVAAIAACREAVRVEDSEVNRQVLKAAVAREVEVETLRGDANHAFSNRNMADAAKLYRELLSISPNESLAMGRLGTCLADQGNLAEATKYWQQVAAADPNDAYGLGMIAWIAYLQKDYPQSIEYYQKASEIEPLKAKLYYQMGMALAMQKQVADAVPLFEKTLSIEPLHTGALEAIVSALRMLNRAGEAVPHATAIVELGNGSSVNNLMILAETFFESGDIEQARAAAYEASKLAKQVDPAMVPWIEQRLSEYATSSAK